MLPAVEKKFYCNAASYAASEGYWRAVNLPIAIDIVLTPSGPFQSDTRITQDFDRGSIHVILVVMGVCAVVAIAQFHGFALVGVGDTFHAQ